jgi:hypothetical protein
LRAAYTKSVTGVGRGPSKARPYADALNVRIVANFMVMFVCLLVGICANSKPR